VVEKDSLATKLESAKQEGILIGQKQQRIIRNEELRQMEELLNDYKAKCDELREKLKEAEIDKVHLEAYNKKADNNIESLMKTLKEEQEKQRGLSEELEQLSVEIKNYKRENA